MTYERYYVPDRRYGTVLRETDCTLYRVQESCCVLELFSLYSAAMS